MISFEIADAETPAPRQSISDMPLVSFSQDVCILPTQCDWRRQHFRVANHFAEKHCAEVLLSSSFPFIQKTIRVLSSPAVVICRLRRHQVSVEMRDVSG